MESGPFCDVVFAGVGTRAWMSPLGAFAAALEEVAGADCVSEDRAHPEAASPIVSAATAAVHTRRVLIDHPFL
jgi:hypothetical protein